MHSRAQSFRHAKLLLPPPGDTYTLQPVGLKGPSYLSLSAARLDEDGEVSNLMWDLVEQDGEGGDGADGGAHQEGRPHGQAVGEVVDEVRCQVEVARHLDV